MRPIDADALVSDIESARNMFFHSPYERRFHEDRIEFALNMVEDVPTLDYAPVRHGEWVEKIEPYAYTASGREIHIFHCSVCDFTWANKRMVFDHFKHCPNCGAKMDKEGNNG